LSDVIFTPERISAMMITKTRRTSYTCPTCDWKGYEAKLSLCSDCGTTFYRCPACGKKAKETERW
tara:strand:- start:57 stop:251 length:195 start_codon:yes stop_codon:yes gene_type:complete